MKGVILKLVNHPPRPAMSAGFTVIRYYGNLFCRRCCGNNLKEGVRFVQYKTNQPQFVTPTQLKISKHGILVYENSLITRNNLPRMARFFLIYMAVSLPVISFIGYCDLVLRNEHGFTFQDWQKMSCLLVVLLFGSAMFTKDVSKRTIKRLYFNRKEMKIYVEAFTGFCKPKLYGPYDPAIGFRRITTKQKKGAYVTEEQLVFEGKPLTAKTVSRERLKKMVENLSIFTSPFSVLKNVEGSDMGNREFKVDVNGVNMKEKKLYKQLFRIRQDEVDEKVEKKQKNRQFD
ncbi:hypothetical protein ACHWQZ_G003984 [Mnemiopsis leidyi]